MPPHFKWQFLIKMEKKKYIINLSAIFIIETALAVIAWLSGPEFKENFFLLNQTFLWYNLPSEHYQSNW